MNFGDAVEFELDFATQQIWVQTQEPLENLIDHLLADQIAPRIIAHKGELVLHGAGVKSAGGILLLVGESGSGKSTLAASLGNDGYELVGDDAMVMSASYGGARSIYRSLRLFPDSVDALVDSRVALTPVASYTSKQNVIYPDGDSHDAPLPIRAVFILDPARSDSIEVEPIPVSNACMAFVEHSFWMDPTDLESTKERMRQASALAARVPAFRLTYPRRYSALPLVHEALASALS